MGGNSTNARSRQLIAAAVRRTRFAIWRGRAWLNRQLILIAYPEVRCETGVSIDPTARIQAFDGGSIVIGRGAAIAAGVSITADGGSVRLGADCYVGIGTTIHAKGAVEIGDDTMLAAYVTIRDHDHATADPTRPYRLQGFVTEPVRLGRNVWLGVKVTVLKGVRIGDDVVVGANAVVTRPIPPGVVATGVPARPHHRVHP